MYRIYSKMSYVRIAIEMSKEMINQDGVAVTLKTCIRKFLGSKHNQDTG
jgi:hypothetical protein